MVLVSLALLLLGNWRFLRMTVEGGVIDCLELPLTTTVYSHVSGLRSPLTPP